MPVPDSLVILLMYSFIAAITFILPDCLVCLRTCKIQGCNDFSLVVIDKIICETVKPNYMQQLFRLIYKYNLLSIAIIEIAGGMRMKL